MKTSHRSKPYFLIILLGLALLLAVGLVFLNYQIRTIYGLPGKSVGALMVLKNSFPLFFGKDEMLAVATENRLEKEKVAIEPDQSVQSLCRTLEQRNLVLSGRLTCLYLMYSGKDRSIQPGNYTIPAGLNAVEVADLVADVNKRDKQFVIYAGWRLEEISALVDELDLRFSGEEFLTLATAPPNSYREKLLIPEWLSLEGYFLPGTYSMEPDISLDEFVAAIMTRFVTAVMTPEFEQNLQRSGLSLHQAITMASIIQRETLAEEEMPLIASVFYNRLAIGMLLQTDPTVQYALGYNAATGTWWKSALTYADLEVNSPYNTYRNPGLPPGPISNPSLAALNAAVAPDETEYLFFRAKCDGSLTHHFSRTYEEHLNYGCE